MRGTQLDRWPTFLSRHRVGLTALISRRRTPLAWGRRCTMTTPWRPATTPANEAVPNGLCRSVGRWHSNRRPPECRRADTGRDDRGAPQFVAAPPAVSWAE